jgi:hypothetical protein
MSMAGLLWALADQGQGEGRARLLETDGQRVAVESTLPFAAGATLVGIDPETQAEYRVKVRGGRRVADGLFRIEGRFVSLTRDERERLLAALAAAQG